MSEMKNSLLAVFVFHLYMDVSFQQVNLSSNGTTSQSSTFSYWDMIFDSHLAVDANPSNELKYCAITAPYQYEAWWILTFPVNTVFIINVSIIYRLVTISRFSYYSLYVSNTTVNAGGNIDGHLCYQHVGPEYPNQIEDRDCNAMGRNVIIFNKRNHSTSYPKEIDNYAWLELCDVKVFGCYKGWQGPNCATDCPVNCIDRHCHPHSGNCIWGCSPENCLNDRCDYLTGVCIDGCKVGFTGVMCEPCQSGTFGQNCTEVCHCFDQACNPLNGTCPAGGCQKGYEGIQCNKVLELEQDKHDCNCTVIIVGLCSTEIVIALIVAAVFYLRRKSRLNHKKTKEQRDIQLDTARYEGFEISVGHEQNPYDVLGSEVEVKNRMKKPCSSDQTYADVNTNHI